MEEEYKSSQEARKKQTQSFDQLCQRLQGFWYIRKRKFRFQQKEIPVEI